MDLDVTQIFKAFEPCLSLGGQAKGPPVTNMVQMPAIVLIKTPFLTNSLFGISEIPKF